MCRCDTGLRSAGVYAMQGPIKGETARWGRRPESSSRYPSRRLVLVSEIASEVHERSNTHDGRYEGVFRICDHQAKEGVVSSN